MASLRVLTSTITTASRRYSTLSSALLSIFTASRTFQTQNSEIPLPSPKPLFPFAKISAPTNPAWKIRAASVATAAASAPIKVGERLPDTTLSYLDNAGNLQTVSIAELAAGKKIVLFAVPGAFTPTCTQKHVPGFIALADDLRARGVDVIACVSVNDAFVLKAWANSIGAGDKLLFLSDGNRQFTDAMGVAVDLSDKPAGLGLRSRRYSLLADDGVVKVLNLEEGGAFTVSGAEEVLKAL